MGSAVDELVNGYDTNQPVSFTDYYHALGRDRLGNDYGGYDPYSLFGRISNWFYGYTDKAKGEYENYLSSYENYQNKKAQQAEWSRQDSQVQRAVNDIRKAGLNPWLALNGGSMSSAIAATDSAGVRYKAREQLLKDSKNNDAKFLGTALKILAMVAIMAA